MEKGIVKWYNETKGFGFIVSDSKKDIFVHRSGIANKQVLQPGDAVEYEIKDGEKGPVAAQVIVIK